MGAGTVESGMGAIVRLEPPPPPRLTEVATVVVACPELACGELVEPVEGVPSL